MSSYSFEFGGKTVTEGSYGGNYIPEFKRTLAQYQTQPARTILEWGSGLTSLVILELATGWKSDLFVTLDTHRPYQDAIFEGKSVPSFVKPVCIDQVGPCISQVDPQYNYSTYPLSLGKKFDLIFIDGRRRMECAYMAALLAHAETLVLIHDYRRTRYQPVLGLFDIIEDGPQFRVLRLRPSLVGALATGYERVRAMLPNG